MDQEQQPTTGRWAVLDPDGGVVESGPPIEMTTALGVGPVEAEEEDDGGVGSR